MSYEKLQAAIFSQDPAAVKAVLAEGVEADTVNEQGRSALALAAACDYGEIIKVLIDAGAPVDKPNDDSLGYTPIIEAARENRQDALITLLELGANPDSKDSRGGTALLHATIAAHPDLIEILKEKGADVNHPDHQGDTPLHYLCRNARAWGSAIVSSWVVEDGVKKEVKPERSRYQEHLDTAEMLIELNAEVSAENNQGFPPLALAVANDANDFAQLLIEAGADPEQGDPEMGITPLQEAARTGNIKGVQMLIEEYGADVNRTDRDGYGSLLWAVVSGSFETVKYLVEQGANLKQEIGADWNEYKTGMTALDVARLKEKNEIAEYLAKNGG